MEMDIREKSKANEDDSQEGVGTFALGRNLAVTGCLILTQEKSQRVMEDVWQGGEASFLPKVIKMIFICKN